MRKNQNVLITGAGGMLGVAVHDFFSKLYSHVLATDIDLNRSWLKYLDVRDLQACQKMFVQFKPDIVLHLAALTDLEYCEKHPMQVWETNALGAENIALLCNQVGAVMVYISTAGVFDGQQDEYTDFDHASPINMYAKSKFYGERYALENLKNSFVFRAGWMMGGGPEKDKKFINKIFQQIAGGKKELFVVNDKLGTPTYTHDFAKGMAEVIETKFFGLYNQVCNGGGSRADVARHFVDLLGLSKEIRVTEVTSDYFKKDYFVPRPYSEMLVNMKLNARNLNFMRDWKTCLTEYAQVFQEVLENHKNEAA